MHGSPLPLGYNTYSLRALRWSDAQLLEFAAARQLDAIFLQDSPDPRAMDPDHWSEVRAMARRLGLHLETGGGGILPRQADGIPQSIATLRRHIQRAAAMGSPFVRCVLAADRASLPAPVEESMEWAVKILRAVRPELSGQGLRAIIEVHKDLQAWELREVIEAAGRDIAGVYLDTGNPVFVLEHPMTTLETLAPYVDSAHLRDSVIYEHPRGVAVQWVPLGEGVIDFRAFVARLAELCPRVHVYHKPITGRPPAVIPYLEQDYWKMFPRARAADLAKFLDLARRGRPYEGRMVVEDIPGRPVPEAFRAAIQHQQLDHVERGLEYAKKELNLGRRWRQPA
ncbi:MAG: sugar phosphate isomerase/epimerase [Bryobacteraceae bacterium]|nr:sugar phosphate isomerase/epimerase [Bryobacteraceae bacterium]